MGASTDGARAADVASSDRQARSPRARDVRKKAGRPRPGNASRGGQRGGGGTRLALRLSRGAGLLALVVTVGASLVYAWQTATGRFYVRQDLPMRFGWGIAEPIFPLGMAGWLDARLERPQPVYIDFNGSSNLMFLSHKVQGVPILTNTWAYPVSRKRMLTRLAAGQDDFNGRTRKWGMDVAVLYVGDDTQPLISRLMADGQWGAAHVEPMQIAFIRRDGQHCSLREDERLKPETFDVPAFVRRCRQVDPVEHSALGMAAQTLQAMGWYSLTEPLWRRSLELRPDQSLCHRKLADCLVVKASGMVDSEPSAAISLLRQARGHYAEALRLYGDDVEARRGLSDLDAVLGRGVR